ncbi:MAG: fatty acid desaturase family protein [Bacteroidia bacterium]
MNTFQRSKLKYEAKDTPEQVFREIRQKADTYFAENKYKKSANKRMWIKVAIQIAMMLVAYYCVLTATSLLTLTISYLLFGWVFIIMGINIGHDAAHHCFTGKKKTDDFVFRSLFGLQGLSGYLWQMRHNHSHHIFPNVVENDADIVLTNLILLSPDQKRAWFHRYQHLYAPFLYMTFSLAWIFYTDIALFFHKKQGNLTIAPIPIKEWVKLFSYKLIYLAWVLVLPIYIVQLPFKEVLYAFFIMHAFLSIFLAFTFFISHHVQEIDYIELEAGQNMVPDSWCHHQVITTIDFNPNSNIAHFIFGGFNTHIAHHLFPEVSHIHYPALTNIIKETFDAHDLDWYKSFSFWQGVRSHLSHLRAIAREDIAH